MKNFFRKLIDFILPPRCINCGEIVGENNSLCVDCFNKIRFISKPYCQICGTPFESTDDLSQNICGKCLSKKRKQFTLERSAFIYDDSSKNILLSLKFRDKISYAPTIAKLMTQAGADIFQENPDLIIPVPLHYMRLLKRKYNQSALLAGEISKLTGIKTDLFSLKRCKNTTPQVKFAGKERVKNVRGAFIVKDTKNIKGKSVVLIDDVMTTGSTLKECAIALKKAGAKKIYALTAARTLR